MKINTNAYFSIKSSIYRNLGGKSENSIFDPSRGGIGMRLKTAKAMFTRTIVLDINKNDSVAKP